MTDKDIIFIRTNELWNKAQEPRITIITSNYNRREVLYRCMKSVDTQTCREIEYIVVDNGSSVNFDDIMEKFMIEASIPVMFIKRSSGVGRHTGRNSAIKEARGEYLCMIDSDDEFLPNCMETLLKAWDSIPNTKRKEYREVVALCEDEFGKQIGPCFPEELNTRPIKQVFKVVQRFEYGVEHASMQRTDIMKDNMFLDPEGVTDSFESIIWWKLMSRYRSYFLNDIVKRYYTANSDSITNVYKKGLTKNACISYLFKEQYYLNHWEDYLFPFRKRIKVTLNYLSWKNILDKYKVNYDFDWARSGLKGFVNNVLAAFLWLPAKLATWYYLNYKQEFIN